MAAVAYSATSANAVTIQADARGWYDNINGSAAGGSAGNNYIVGDCGGAQCASAQSDFRNWFVFDLTGLAGPLLSATLLLDVPASGPGFDSDDDGTETYTLFDIDAGNVGSLGTPSAAIAADLGSGVSYGSYIATSADNGATIAITLNAAGLAAVNGALGGLFAVGGAITTLNGVADDEYLFGFTLPQHLTQLDLVFEPADVAEPGTLALFGLALTGFGAARRRRD